MSDKRYFWIKLKTNFFEQETIDFLMSQKNGCEYIVLYQMLCLKTANTDGQLISRIGEMIVPYDVNKIVRDTKYFDYDTVTVALELFKQLGLIYFQAEDNTLKIANYGEMIGSETSAAARMRKSREKKALVEKKERNIVTSELHKSIEYRDKSIENKSIDNKDIQSCVDKWNSLPDPIPEVKRLTTTRKSKLSARFKDFGAEELIRAIDLINQSSFLKGENKNGWVISFDWFVEPRNLTKILENTYTDRKPTNKLQSKPSFDIAEIERQAIYNDDFDV